MKHISQLVAAKFKTEGTPVLVATKGKKKNDAWASCEPDTPVTRAGLRAELAAGFAKARVQVGDEVKEFGIETLLALE